MIQLRDGKNKFRMFKLNHTFDVTPIFCCPYVLATIVRFTDATVALAGRR